VAFVVAGGLGLSACQGTAPMAATVNGHRITQAAVVSELNAIVANKDYTAAIQASNTAVVGAGGSGTFDLAFTNRVLSRQILYELIHEEVVRRHLVVGPNEIKAAAAAQLAQIGKDSTNTKDLFPEFTVTYQDLLSRRAAEFTALQNDLGGPNDAAVQSYYNANKAQFVQNCASHILVATQAQADSLHAQLVAGADFATLAKQFSTDSASAVKGGDLGCAPAGTYVAEFEAALQVLAVGQLSPVVHSQFGYHIIKLTARQAQPVSTVRTQILQQLLSQFVQAQVSKATVDLNPRYGTYDKTTGNITLPKAPTPAQGGGTPTTAAPAGLGQTAPPPTAPAGTQVPTSTP
jgi:foldase protein PrsA